MTKIKRQPVTSSLISSIGYNPATKELDIAFKSFKPDKPESVYRYQNVDAQLHAELMSAQSIGKFFKATIKTNSAVYPYQRLTPEEAAQ